MWISQRSIHNILPIVAHKVIWLQQKDLCKVALKKPMSQLEGFHLSNANCDSPGREFIPAAYQTSKRKSSVVIGACDAHHNET